MRVLLDTQVWLWMLVEPERLSKPARHLVEDLSNELLLSAASSWEIAIKWGIGRLPLPEPPSSYVPSRIQSTGVRPLAIEHSHVLLVADLPLHHRDPFDRLLAAQAVSEDVPLLTADPSFGPYGIELIAAG